MSETTDYGASNTGAILELNKKISVIRSRNLSISCIFQNLPQMQNRYPYNQWQEIIGNCDTQLFLGCTDEVTATFISNRSGDVTVGVSSEAKQLNSWRVSDYTPEYRQTKSIGKRKLSLKAYVPTLLFYVIVYLPILPSPLLPQDRKSTRLNSSHRL